MKTVTLGEARRTLVGVMLDEMRQDLEILEAENDEHEFEEAYVSIAVTRLVARANGLRWVAEQIGGAE